MKIYTICWPVLFINSKGEPDVFLVKDKKEEAFALRDALRKQGDKAEVKRIYVSGSFDVYHGESHTDEPAEEAAQV
jgi:hypothetical protein